MSFCLIKIRAETLFIDMFGNFEQDTNITNPIHSWCCPIGLWIVIDNEQVALCGVVTATGVWMVEWWHVV